MKKLVTLLLLTAATFVCTEGFCAEDTPICEHTTKQSSDNYFGVAQLRLVPFVVQDEFAIAFLGEFGPKSCRVNGTAGAFYDSHQIKFGAEYLGQKLGYNFSTGRVRRWVDQYAVGGCYQYVFDCGWLDALYVDASSAYANGIDLTSIECNFVTGTSVARHLAGSRYFDVEFGGRIMPWKDGLLSLGIGYNNLRYDKEVSSSERKFQGVSGSIAFNQRINEAFVLDVNAQFRRAYNYAEALLAWEYETCCGMLSLGLFGGYVWGKTDLPSSTTAGVELGFVFGPYRNCCQPINCCAPVCCTSACRDLIAWVSDPGVYIPTVLVVAEQRISTPVPQCTTPTIVSQIPDTGQCSPSTYNYDISPYFAGDAPLVYSVSAANTLPGDSITIDPNTGVIFFNFNGGAYTTKRIITVTVSSGACSVSQTFLAGWGLC